MEDSKQGVRREEGARWEQIADYTKQQVRKGLTSPEESRDSISRAGMTDDGLQGGAQALPTRQGLALFIVKPLDVSLREAAITIGKGRGDRVGRELRAIEGVTYPFAGKGIVEAGCVSNQQRAGLGAVTRSKRQGAEASDRSTSARVTERA
jgi:hypothetical protein